jgi:general secretion pathway protein L
MSTLIIQLPACTPTGAAPVRFVHLVEGTVAPHVQECPLALLPGDGTEEIVATVPVDQVSWHVVELPAGTIGRRVFNDTSVPRLRAILDGVLEERLLDDAELLHFSLAPNAQAGAPVWIAVCERAWLRAWLSAIEQAGKTVTRVIPEFAPALGPDEANAIYATGTTETPRLVRTSAKGVSVVPLTASTASLLVPSNTLAIDPQNAPIWAEPGVAELAEQMLGRVATLQTEAQRLLATLASPWDLAQFEFSASRQARSRKRWSAVWSNLTGAPEWRLARWSLAAIVLVNLVGLQTWTWREQKAQSAKRAEITSILKLAFPQVQVVVDAPAQMARSLADLQRQSGIASDSDLEAVLQSIGQLGGSNQVPTVIDYAGGEVRLQGLTAASPDMANLLSGLKNRGYAARWDAQTLVIQADAKGGKP